MMLCQDMPMLIDGECASSHLPSALWPSPSFQFDRVCFKGIYSPTARSQVLVLQWATELTFAVKFRSEGHFQIMFQGCFYIEGNIESCSYYSTGLAYALAICWQKCSFHVVRKGYYYGFWKEKISGWRNRSDIIFFLKCMCSRLTAVLFLQITRF